ncbi:MAG: hypothetical protein K0Q60_4232, partial [Microvirga sp.]|nr:hypothetical protein [Microvirga sp.]
EHGNVRALLLDVVDDVEDVPGVSPEPV